MRKSLTAPFLVSFPRFPWVLGAERGRKTVYGVALVMLFLAVNVFADPSPSISTQPESQNVVIGSNAIFTVTAEGQTPLTYQWQFDGSDFAAFMMTIAGTGTEGYTGDGGPAVDATLNFPRDVILDSRNNLFVADTRNHCIRKIDANGIISTVAGNGTNGYTGDDVAATNTSLNSPIGMCFDSAGNLYIADSQNSRIRKVDTNGVITTFAGNGTNGFSGDGGMATNASLNVPTGICFDSAGDLIIADQGNERVREVNASDVITTIAGNGVGSFSGDGGDATNASMYYPGAVAVDHAGNIYIADAYDEHVRKVGANGIITTFAGDGGGFSGDGGPATNAGLFFPSGLCFDSAGELLIADEGNCRIRQVDTNGIITTIAGNADETYTGDNLPATSTGLANPSGVAVDAFGNIFIADSEDCRIREVEATDNSALTFNDVTLNLPGNYQVIVSNAYGSVTSSVATLAVEIPAAIISQSASQGVFLSNNVAFAVSATGTAPLAYQWYFDGAPLTDNAGVSVSATATLSIQDVQSLNFGDYQVVVTNAWGSSTSSVIVLDLATVHYVNGNSASPASPYTSWSTAASTIQQAVEASFAGDEILVTNGTYSTDGRIVYGSENNRVALDRSVAVQSVNGPQVTIIQGASATRCAWLTNGAALVGFTLQNGRTLSASTNDWFKEESGAGVWCESTSATVSNCIIKQNYVVAEGGGAYSGTLIGCVITSNQALEGAGSATANLVNCTLIANAATWGGGAYYGSLSNCTVSGNSARDPGGSQEGEGGGAYSCNIANCILTGNSSRVDGGAAAWGSLVNCLVTGNASAEGGGVSAGNIENCTVVGNTAYTSGSALGLGGGILGGSAENSIIINNADSFSGAQDFDGTSLSYCCSSSNPGGSGNIVAGPLFVNSGGGDYRLQLGSPCIDTGSNGLVTATTDLDGNPRIVDGAVDMGAYEYQHNPWVLTSPANENIPVGSNLVLTVTVLGDPASLQWYYNGAPLSDGGRILGSVSNVLTISTTVTNDSGDYWVTASNSYGEVTSTVAVVTVQLPVNINGEPVSQTVLAGSNATFTVTATGFIPPNYIWYSNGIVMANGGRISGATSAALTISTTQTNDDGAYDVIVTNAYGTATSSIATLTVVAPVQIIGQPASAAVLLGSNATFTAVAGGTGPFTYQWYFDGAPLTDGGRITGSATATLSIANAQSSDAGGYIVMVSNLLSSATSLTASLTPEVTLGPSVRYVMLTSPNPTAPYLNWSTAATNIQDAVDAAVAGDVVLVSNGLYNAGGRVFFGTATNRLVVNKAITVQSLNGPTATTVMGIYNPTAAHPMGRCAYLTNNALLSGFTLVHGGAIASGDTILSQSGGGVWCQSPSAVVSNCVFILDYAPYYGGGAFGGTLINCLVETNTAGNGGGAASNVLLNCTIIKNVAGSGNFVNGGGTFGSTLSNCTLIANSANTGGGAYGGVLFNCVLMTNSALEFGGGGYSSTFYNCVLENNSSRDGGGAYNSVLDNCTVVSNSAPDGAGIYGGAATNCIIYYNYNNGSVANTLNSKLGAYICTYPAFLPGCITNPPLFVNLAGEDFHLQSASPCINSGINAAVSTATDLDGNPRIAGETVDMGAYEYQTPSSVISYAYLQQYGLPTDGSVDYADLDGAAFNVYQDWVAGLNPTNPASVLVLRAPAATTNTSGITVTWQSVNGISYNIQRSTNLSVQPAFSTIRTNMPGLTGTTSFRDTTATNNIPYFYRVDVLAP